MADVLLSPDVEAVVITGLSPGLPDAKVSTKVPNPRPAKLVRVRRRGGPRADVVLETALILIECWATAETDASDLAVLTAGLFAALEGQTVAGHHITHAEILGGPSNDPDPETGTPRYTLTGQIVTFADPA